MRWYSFIYYVQWQDVVDVFFLTFLLYRFTVLFWGTNAFQILLGISFLWLLGLGARETGLILTNWILQGLGAISVIIMVVIFRNEIRDALFRINPIHLFMGTPKQTLGQEYPGLVNAVFSLAERRIGALLVFPQRRKVDEFIREGVEVRAIFSKELLESIFHPQSPLHDGAVILENGRITKAACFLPLTERVNLPLRYGTRHRAAIGLTEKTDALVVAISEERGSVSVAENGNLSVVPKPEFLEQKLREVLEGEHYEPEGGQKRRAKPFPRNWHGRLGALAVSVIVWFLFVGEKESLISMNLPLEFRNLPRTMYMVSSSADRVELQLSGRQHMIASLSPGQLRAFLDLGNAKVGSNVFSLTAANVLAPVGIRVSKIFPTQVMVFMEELVTRTVEVRPTFTGDLPNGKKLVGSIVTPGRITVIGPSSAVTALEAIRTEAINLASMDKSQEVEVGVIVSPASINLAPNQPARVRVKVEIAASSASEDTSTVE